MRILVAPLHYVSDPHEGSEYTRADFVLTNLMNNPEIEADVIVGFTTTASTDRVRIHQLMKEKPKYISNLYPLFFIIKVWITAQSLLRKHTYDAIWHVGPFAFDKTFSLVSILNNKKIPFCIGPINTPHTFMGTDEGRAMGKKLIKNPSVWLKLLKSFDDYTYPLGKIFSILSNVTLKRAHLIFTADTAGQTFVELRTQTPTKMLTLIEHIPEIARSDEKRSDKKIVLLNVSYLVERKHTEDLISAMDLIVNRDCRTDVILHIVGDGPQREKLRQLIAQKQLVEFVQLKGYIPREQTPQFYADADLFISASISESMPSMYFEAMSAKLPMILARNQTTVDLERAQVAAEFVEPNNPEKIVEAIKKSIDHRSDWLNKGQQNYEVLHNRFNNQKAMSQLIQHLKDIISVHASSS